VNPESVKGTLTLLSIHWVR